MKRKAQARSPNRAHALLPREIRYSAHHRELLFTRAARRYLLERVSSRRLPDLDDLSPMLMATCLAAARKANIPPRSIDALLPGLIHSMSNVFTAIFTEAAVASTGTQLKTRMMDRRAFERSLAARWGTALDLAEIIHVIAVDGAARLHQRHRNSPDDHLYTALIRLHARGALVASEILALLRTGHASGAHARWRSLYEITVVATFVDDGGPEVAHRYLQHAACERYRALADYQRFADRLGYERLREAQLVEAKKDHDALCEEFGRNFASDYGWATPDLPGRPTFRQIEDSVRLGHWRPYYKMASHPTHAGSQGLVFELGLLDGYEHVLLSGPSNAGLADPGYGLCLSFTHLSFILLSHAPDLGDLVTMQVLAELRDRAIDEFGSAHRELATDHSRQADPGDQYQPMKLL